MPVAVVALAAGSFAAGATAFAAATTLAATIAAGATMVGAALTIVGTVTGNAKLTKIGAVVGLAGGIGTMLTSGAEAAASGAAGAAADGADAAASGAGAAGAAADASSAITTAAVPDLAEGITGSTAASASGGGMLDAAAGAAPAASSAPAAAGGGMLDAVKAASATTDPLAQAQASTTSAFDAANTGAGQAASTSAFNAGPNAFTPNADAAMGATAIPADPSALSRAATGVTAWAKANPELAKMALSAGGTMLGNLVPSEKDKAMMEAYKAQATATAAQTDAAKRKAAWGAGRTTY